VSYTVKLSDRATETLRELDKPIAKRIANRFIWLGHNAEVIKHQPLKGQWQGLMNYTRSKLRGIQSVEQM
jgi:mRNA-degrading endonuclease RelE of RelBE toxin-antitoxin system